MKRTKVIKAKKRSVQVTVTIKIDATPYYWTRDEVNDMAENLTSSIMEQIPNTHHIAIPLSKIKIQ